jgi:hypothetical protein
LLGVGRVPRTGKEHQETGVVTIVMTEESECSIDRKLNQLERLQRMRWGQPVLPKLEVGHSQS